MVRKPGPSKKHRDGDAIRAAQIGGRYAIVAALLAALVGAAVSAAFTNGFGLFPAKSSRPTASAPRSDSGSHCSPAGGSPGIVQPTPSTSKRLTFCTVLINGGSLPITGSFDLSGQVIGPASVRKGVVLVNYFDPRTCDALGNVPAPGAFLISQVNLSSPDGIWSYTDELGYPEVVTLGRNFEYISASPKSIQKMKNDRANWQASGKNPRKYPGILTLPGYLRG